MAEKKIVVPEGMLAAACSAQRESVKTAPSQVVRDGFEAALRWLDEELKEMMMPLESGVDQSSAAQYNTAISDVRRMFDALEEEVPDEIKDLLITVEGCTSGGAETIEASVARRNRDVIEAFRRGQSTNR